MDVNYNDVVNLKITNEIIEVFGEPPKTYAKKVKKVVLIAVLIAFLLVGVAQYFAFIVYEDDYKMNEMLIIPSVALFWAVLIIGLVIHKIVKSKDDDKIFDYKYQVFLTLMKDPDFFNKIKKIEKERKENEESLEDYLDRTEEIDEEWRRILEEQEEE